MMVWCRTHHLWDTVLTAAVSTQVNVSNVAALTTTGRLIAVVSTIVIAVAVERLHQALCYFAHLNSSGLHLMLCMIPALETPDLYLNLSI